MDVATPASSLANSLHGLTFSRSNFDNGRGNWSSSSPHSPRGGDLDSISPVLDSVRDRSRSIQSNLSGSRPSSRHNTLDSRNASTQGHNSLDTQHLSASQASRPNSALDSPSFVSLAEVDSSQSQPRSFEKMQDSMLSDSSTASGIIDQISLLPDELVCVGLNMAHEKIWRSKITHAIFFFDDVLPRRSDQQKKQATSQLLLEDEADEESRDTIGSLDVFDTSSAASRATYSTTPTPNRPMSSRTQIPRGERTLSSTSGTSQNKPSLLCATEDADYPVSLLLS